MSTLVWDERRRRARHSSCTHAGALLAATACVRRFHARGQVPAWLSLVTARDGYNTPNCKQRLLRPLPTGCEDLRRKLSILLASHAITRACSTLSYLLSTVGPMRPMRRSESPPKILNVATETHLPCLVDNCRSASGIPHRYLHLHGQHQTRRWLHDTFTPYTRWTSSRKDMRVRYTRGTWPSNGSAPCLCPDATAQSAVSKSSPRQAQDVSCKVSS